MIEQEKKDIPPGLLRIVKGNKPSKKFFLLVGSSLFLIIAGFSAIYFYEKYFPIEAKNEPIPSQRFTQNIPQSQAHTQQLESKKKSNLNENSKTLHTKQAKIMDNANPSEQNQKRETLKIANKTNRDNKPTEIALNSLETFKGADFLYRAKDFEEKGLINEAINEYKEYVNYSGKAEQKILNKIATLYLLVGNLKEAEHYAELAINSSKNDKEILINYGVIKAKMGKLNEAEEIFYKVLSLDSQNKNAIYNLAILKEKKGNKKEALNLYERLYQLGDTSVISSIERLK